MPEHQAIGWKEAWHDEQLEWICGYANAYGDKLYICKNDDGNVTGISDKDRKKLLEIIPNKIIDTKETVANILRFVAWDVNRFRAQHMMEDIFNEGIELLQEEVIRQ